MRPAFIASDRLLPTLALLTGAFLWASSFPAMKIAVTAYHPMPVMAGRLLTAALLFLLVRRNFRFEYRKGDWKWLLFMAFSEPCCYFLFESYALTQTTASQAGMVAATLPVMVALVAGLTLSERSSPRVWVGFLLAFAGVALLSALAEASEAAPNPVLGNILEFIAMATAVGYMVTLKHLSSRYGPWFLTAVQAWVGALFFLPVAAVWGAFDPAAVFTGGINLLALGCIVFLGSVVSIGAYGCYNVGLSRLPASQASAFINLIPVLAAVMGVVLLDERFTFGQVLASGLVLLGVYLSQERPSVKTRNTTAEPAVQKNNN